MKTMKLYQYIIFILIAISQGCFSVPRKKLDLSNKDTFWKVSNNGNERLEVLFIDSVKIEENYYQGDTFVSFYVYDNKCGEYTFLDENSLSKNDFDTAYSGCEYTDIIGNRIDSLWSFYLPMQNNKDSFSLTLWFTVERTCKYSYSIYKDTIKILDINSNSPIIRCKFPFSKKDEVCTYYIKKRTFYQNKTIETGPFEMFKENGEKIWWNNSK